jgi:imidazoleglycerol-phosphate dehydratase
MTRQGTCTRETGETSVSAEIDLDGSGESTLATGLGMLDHMLTLLARHARFDLRVQAKGDLQVDEHHTAEDVAIALGRALSQALGERRGIVRMGDATVPMDEALALVAVDLGGRAACDFVVELERERVGDLPTELVRHFFESLAQEARLNVHVRLLAGANDHHRMEAIFKAAARALDQATRLDPRLADRVPSTKGLIET